MLVATFDVWLWPLLSKASMYILGHFFVSKFLKEIQVIAIVIFCVWISHPQNFVNLLLFLTNFSLFVLTQFVLEKVYNFLDSEGYTKGLSLKYFFPNVMLL